MFVYTQSLQVKWQTFWDFFTAYGIRAENKLLTKEVLFGEGPGGEAF